MTEAHLHHPPGRPGATVVEWSVALPAALAVVAGLLYVVSAAALRRRGDHWPRLRDLSFTAGIVTLVAALLVPLPVRPFTGHMIQHLAAAMVAPLLLVLSRPLTLTLRTVRWGAARRGLLTVLHSRPAAWLVFPPAAAVLDLGGLWLLYRTPLFAPTGGDPLLRGAVHVHVVVAGLLFTVAVCQLDPVRHRWSLAWRGGTLLAAGAAHAVLAKSLYLAPPPGTDVGAADLHAGAQVMYYGGDAVELALAAVLAGTWYARRGRSLRHSSAVRRSFSMTAGNESVRQPTSSDWTTRRSASVWATVPGPHSPWRTLLLCANGPVVAASSAAAPASQASQNRHGALASPK